MQGIHSTAARTPRLREAGQVPSMAWPVRGALLAAVLVAGCATRPVPGSGPGVRVESLEAIGWQIAERPCDTPLRVDRKPQANAFDPKVTDEVIETHCAGLTTTVYVAHATQPPKLLPASVQLTARHPALPAGLQVGSPAAKVLALLGAPTLRDPAALAYRMGPQRPDSDALRFIIRQDKVAAIEWAWYID
ncbi:hypothetical protein [Azohydromonas aeria]|uniref:hypothetical protein n=1 Tax=Azohydromonas aeria TaxID=2590212 RepID=UPI0012FBEDEB|nr:hypothetical protein [Azohydromonas aeria]